MSFAETFKALSDPVRREILQLLKNGPMSAGDIGSHFDMTGATVSYHLKILKKADLIWEKKENISNKMMILVLWIVPVISIFACGSMYIYAFNNAINTTTIGMMVIGCIFLVVGNYMPKMKQNYSLGIKAPWTLNSEENWNRTHRLGGYAFMVGGVMILIAGFTQMFWLVPVAMLICVIIPVAYSYSLYKKGV